MKHSMLFPLCLLISYGLFAQDSVKLPLNWVTDGEVFDVEEDYGRLYFGGDFNEVKGKYRESVSIG